MLADNQISLKFNFGLFLFQMSGRGFLSFSLTDCAFKVWTKFFSRKVGFSLIEQFSPTSRLEAVFWEAIHSVFPWPQTDSTFWKKNCWSNSLKYWLLKACFYTLFQLFWVSYNTYVFNFNMNSPNKNLMNCVAFLPWLSKTTLVCPS